MSPGPVDGPVRRRRGSPTSRRAGHALAGRRVWVVGASSGIGEALARELHRRGAHLVLTARRADRLEDLAAALSADPAAGGQHPDPEGQHPDPEGQHPAPGGQHPVPEGQHPDPGGHGSGTGTGRPAGVPTSRVRRPVAVPADVTDPGAVASAALRAERSLGGLDTVVWCAGYWRRSDAASWDREDFARHVEVNLLGLNNVLASVLPGMVRRGHGHLVGVASVAGYRGLSGGEAYAATKSAQITLLESLRASLGHRGVRVTTVCPGFVSTEMTAGNDFPMPFMISADSAARAIADGLERGRTEIVFPLPIAVAMKVARVLPVRVWTALSTRAAARSRSGR